MLLGKILAIIFTNSILLFTRLVTAVQARWPGCGPVGVQQDCYANIVEYLYFDSVCFFAHGYSGLRPASERAAHRRRSLFAPGCMIILKVFCYN